MSKKGGKSTPSKGEKGDKTRTTPTNELVPGILDNEEYFSKYRGSQLGLVIVADSKRGCVLPMVIWPTFRMGQYRVNDHPYHAPQFRSLIL